MLEVVDGRPPLPRIAPPYRRGVIEVVEHDDDVDTGSGASRARRAGRPGARDAAPPALVDNVETLANVAAHHRRGRRVVPGPRHRGVAGHDRLHGHRRRRPAGRGRDAAGHDRAPGHRGHRRRARRRAAGQGRPQRRVGRPSPAGAARHPADLRGHGGRRQRPRHRRLHRVRRGHRHDRGAAGVARFLAVESCGQCTPCKADGLALADALDRLCAGPRRPSRPRHGSPAPSRRSPTAPAATWPASSRRWSGPILARLGRRGRPPGHRPRRGR